MFGFIVVLYWCILSNLTDKHDTYNVVPVLVSCQTELQYTYKELRTHQIFHSGFAPHYFIYFAQANCTYLSKEEFQKENCGSCSLISCDRLASAVLQLSCSTFKYTNSVFTVFHIHRVYLQATLTHFLPQLPFYIFYFGYFQTFLCVWETALFSRERGIYDLG